MDSKKLNADELVAFIEQQWDESIIPTLSDFISIPNVSPSYDEDWGQKGYMEQAVELLANWCQQQPIVGMQLQVHRLEGRTPLLLLDIPGDINETILLYGHLDKQPEMTGWTEGLGAWVPCSNSLSNVSAYLERRASV